ncbi:hypothetical protein M885DRAFT_617858 [Pelagophyceae sp. CCMP2097]|nr:hypothetical protein M885DRAFT_617858 [Pelagophyceae sp. CCMP2097]
MARPVWLFRVCAALGAVVSAAPAGGLAADVLARGFAVVDGAVDGPIAAEINRKVHARVSVGGCSGGHGDTVSKWLHKVCALPVDDADTFAVLGNLTREFAKVVEAVAGPNARLCDHAATIAYPGAAPADVTAQNAAVTVFVFLDGVAEATAAPLHVWPETHRIDRSGPPPTAKLAPPQKLAPLQPGAVVVYDGRLERRFAANDDASPRSAFYFSYCPAGTAASTMMPEDRGADGLGRLGLADVVADHPDAAASTGGSESESDDQACLDMLVDAAPILTPTSDYGGAVDSADAASDDDSRIVRLLRDERLDGDEWRRRYQSEVLGAARPVDEYGGGEVGVRSPHGGRLESVYEGENEVYNDDGEYENDDESFNFYDSEFMEKSAQLTQLDDGRLDGDEYDDDFDAGARFRGGASDDGALYDDVIYDTNPSHYYDPPPDDDAGACAAARGAVADMPEAEISRFPPCTWPAWSTHRGPADLRARVAMALFRRVAARDQAGRCGEDLLAAFTEVGAFRRDSVLWDVVDRDSALAGAPPGRRAVLEQAWRVVDGAVAVERQQAAHRGRAVAR